MALLGARELELQSDREPGRAQRFVSARAHDRWFRFRGNVAGTVRFLFRRFGVPLQQSLVARLPFVLPRIDDLLERLDHQRAALGGHRRGDHDHTVLVVPVQTPPRLAGHPLPILPADPFVGPDQAFQLRRAAGAGNVQQHRFAFLRGDPRDGTHLGVAQHAVAERCVDVRQPCERTSDSDALAGGAGSEAAAVVEPVAEVGVAGLRPAAGAVHSMGRPRARSPKQ